MVNKMNLRDRIRKNKKEEIRNKVFLTLAILAVLIYPTIA